MRPRRCVRNRASAFRCFDFESIIACASGSLVAASIWASSVSGSDPPRALFSAFLAARFAMAVACCLILASSCFAARRYVNRLNLAIAGSL
jgi:hypothetical protein